MASKRSTNRSPGQNIWRIHWNINRIQSHHGDRFHVNSNIGTHEKIGYNCKFFFTNITLGLSNANINHFWCGRYYGNTPANSHLHFSESANSMEIFRFHWSFAASKSLSSTEKRTAADGEYYNDNKPYLHYTTTPLRCGSYYQRWWNGYCMEFPLLYWWYSGFHSAWSTIVYQLVNVIWISGHRMVHSAMCKRL